MTIGTEKDKRFLANSIFPSFFYATLALVLGQVGAAQTHGSWSLRVFLGALEVAFGIPHPGVPRYREIGPRCARSVPGVNHAADDRNSAG